MSGFRKNAAELLEEMNYMLSFHGRKANGKVWTNSVFVCVTFVPWYLFAAVLRVCGF